MVGVNLIKEFEGLRLKAYIPVKGDVPTIGWGHTKGVKMGDKITIATAEKFLAQDIAPTVAAVNQAIKVPVTQNEFDACVSLAFNKSNPAGISSLEQVQGETTGGPD